MKKLCLIVCCLFLFTGCGESYDKVTVCEKADWDMIVTLYSKGNEVYLLEMEEFQTFDTISEAMSYEKEQRESWGQKDDNPKKFYSVSRNNKVVSFLFKNYAYEKSYKEAVKNHEERNWSCKEN